jgi:hypothetical protein
MPHFQHRHVGLVALRAAREMTEHTVALRKNEGERASPFFHSEFIRTDCSRESRRFVAASAGKWQNAPPSDHRHASGRIGDCLTDRSQKCLS